MPRLAGDAPRMLWQADLRDRTRSTVTRYEPVVANDVVLLPIQYRASAVLAALDVSTGAELYSVELSAQTSVPKGFDPRARETGGAIVLVELLPGFSQGTRMLIAL